MNGWTEMERTDTRWSRPGNTLGSAMATALLLLGTVAGAPAQESVERAGRSGDACPAPATIVAELEGPAADIRYLSDDALEGREVATRGARCAADYLADRFREVGLEAPEGSYFQPFLIRTGAALGPDSRLDTPDASYTAGSEWVPYGFSARRSVTAPLVYAGSGISNPGAPDDVFTRLDLRGRIAVVESGDPSASDGQTVRSDPHFKATVAAGRGAAGLLVLLSEGASLPEPTDEIRGPLAIPAGAVTGEAAAAVRRMAMDGMEATLAADVSIRTDTARNVVGLLPGGDPELRDEWIVVGAHYDHLGFGGEGSLAPDQLGTIHNGADDNASGTAGIVEAARILSEGPRPDRSVLFIGFTGEEKGLWGSSFYARYPLHPLDRTKAMLNLDMVGRLGDDELTILGVATAEEWEEVIEDANRRLEPPLPLALVPDGYGASDHSSFFSQGIPVLHFFTNTHEDYHRPTDDFERVDVPGTRRVAELVAEVALSLAGRGSERMAADLTLVAESPHEAGGTGDPGGVQGYGPYLGTVPDMSPRAEGGVRLTGVREGSPAADAGIRAGDVIVEFAGREITDLYAYTYALQDHRPGDRVEIVVEREGERVTLTATLEER